MGKRPSYEFGRNKKREKHLPYLAGHESWDQSIDCSAEKWEFKFRHKIFIESGEALMTKLIIDNYWS